MKTRIHALCAAATFAVASLAIHVPDAVAAAPSARAAGESAPAPSRRYQLVHRLVMKWGAHVHEAYGLSPHAWTREMGDIFAMSSLDTLQRAADAGSFDAMSNILLGKAPAGSALRPGPVQTLLGDAAADLVYVPVTPCRIFDTRLAGGAIAGETSRNFDVTAVANYSAQGGASTDCGIGAAGSFAAAAITFTVVAPTGNPSYITAYPLGEARPTAATLAFNGAGLSTSTSVIKLDQGPSSAEMSVYAGRQVHLVGDVIGYFTAPESTALECTEVVNGPDSMAAGSSLGMLSGACPASYQVTGGSCMMNSIHGRVVTTQTRVGSNDHFCSFFNESISPIQATVKATCCRVPGR